MSVARIASITKTKNASMLCVDMDWNRIGIVQTGGAGMAEWIVDFHSRDPSWFEDGVITQKLVRCKDCKHYNRKMKMCEYMDIYPWPDGNWFCPEGVERDG